MIHHNKSTGEVLVDLNSSYETGLTEEEAQFRQLIQPTHSNFEISRENLISKVVEHIKEPLKIILFISSIISYSTGHFLEGTSIIFAVLLYVSVFVFFEIKAENITQQTRRILDDTQVTVFRSETFRKISQKMLAVGDIVYLKTGDKVPAEGRIIWSDNLYADEYAITEIESAVLKHSDIIEISDDKLKIEDLKNTLFKNTFVVNGRCTYVVTTNENTAYSHLMPQTSTSEDIDSGDENVLSKKVSIYSKNITIIGIIFATFILGLDLSNILRGNGYVGSLELFYHIKTAVVFSIALIFLTSSEPYFTISNMIFPLNLKNMLKDLILPKNLNSLMKITNINTFLVDKEGYIANHEFQVLDAWVNGKFVPPNEIETLEILENICINSSCKLHEAKIFIAVEDPSENALLECAKDNKINHKELLKLYPKLKSQFLFSKTRKIMTTVVDNLKGYRVYSKGSPEEILALSDRILTHNKITTFTEDHKLETLLRIREFQNQAKTVIAFAHNDISQPRNWENPKELERNLVFDGFLALETHLKLDALQTIDDLELSNLDVKIFTRQEILHAKALASKAGSFSQDLTVFDYSSLENNPDSKAELLTSLNNIKVFANCTCASKANISLILFQKSRNVGICLNNDDELHDMKDSAILFAKGINGTAVTKEACDIVFLNDSFSCVQKSIKWSKAFYANFQKIMQFQMILIFSLLGFCVISQIISNYIPFKTIHLLWFSIIFGAIFPIVLSLDTPERRRLVTTLNIRRTPLFSKKMIYTIVSNSCYIVFCMTLLLLLNPAEVTNEPLVALNPSISFIFPLASSPTQSASILISAFFLFNLWNLINCRELTTRSIFTVLSGWKLFAIAISGAFLLSIILASTIGTFFGLTNLSVLIWLKLLLLSFSIVIFNEILKLPAFCFVKIKNSQKAKDLFTLIQGYIATHIEKSKNKLAK